MENIADALKMAGSVLMFVMAIATAILSFSQARVAVDDILSYSDREYLTIQDERFYYLADTSKTNRNVGLDTIIPTIHRAYQESYKVVFLFPDDYYLYRTEQEIDLDKQKVKKLQEVVGDKNRFLRGILYHDFKKNPTDLHDDIRDFKLQYKVLSFPTQTLFEYLKDKLEGGYIITEHLGVYDEKDIDTTPGSDLHERTRIPSDFANENIRRVITYEIKLP